MGFRFIHTADWQLGKTLNRLGPEKAAQLKDARLGIVQRIADLANAQGIEHVLVAGDVWEHEVPSDQVLRQPLDRMAQAVGQTWWLLPGNHDPAKPQEETLWDRIKRWGVPPNVRLLTDPAPHSLAPGITLLPAPWPSKRPGRDLTSWFGGEGALIGIAHGGTKSFSNEADESATIHADRAEKSGLAYLALGDFHGLQRAAPRTFYSGTPEPDNFKKNEKGKLLLVDLDQPDQPEAHPVGQFEWQRQPLELDSIEPLKAMLSRGGVLDRTLLRLKLSGRLSHADRAVAKAFLTEQASRYFLLEADWSGVETALDQESLDERLADGLLGRVSAQLLARQGEPVAQEALRLLASLVRA